MYKTLSAALVWALVQPAWAVSTTFTYQGALEDAGSPANGSYDLRFTLLGLGPSVPPLVLEDVAVSAGIFSVELDFGAVITSTDYQLQIDVRPGASSGAFTPLSPSTPVRPAPQAQIAAMATEAVSVSPNAVNSVSIADGSVGVADIHTGQVQARVATSCDAGAAIRVIAADGSVICQPVGGVSSIETGAGLSGGPITGSGTIAVAIDGITGGMIQNGTVQAADIDANEVQRRVGNSCPAGSGIRAIAMDGTVSCESIPPGPFWSLAGNAGTDAATQFLGSTDAQAVVIRTHNVQGLRLEPSGLPFSGPNTINVIAGGRTNSVTAGVRGATVMGGGAVAGSEGIPFAGQPNRVTDHYGLVAGGYENRAGNANASPSDAQFAAVVGGTTNRAEAEYSGVFGGFNHQVSGAYSVLIGGRSSTIEGSESFVGGGFAVAAAGSQAAVLSGNNSCAGGDNSFAGGNQAQVRPRTGITTGACAAVGNSGDGNGDEGAFVWADRSSNDAYISTGPNQFMIRADGGLMFNHTGLVANSDDLLIGARKFSGDADVDLRLITRSGRNALLFVRDSNGALTLSLPSLTTGTDRLVVSGGTGGSATLSHGGSWTNASSRSYKSDFMAVDPLDVLARVVDLPISRWNYIGSTEGEHMGPMAEDFKAAFGLAGNGSSIATVDADGVALAAIQGLNRKLEAENAELRRRLERIEARLNAH